MSSARTRLDNETAAHSRIFDVLFNRKRPPVKALPTVNTVDVDLIRDVRAPNRWSCIHQSTSLDAKQSAFKKHILNQFTFIIGDGVRPAMCSVVGRDEQPKGPG